MCGGSLFLLLLGFFCWFDFLVCECAGMQAGGYVCNYFKFIVLELISWSLSESS